MKVEIRRDSAEEPGAPREKQYKYGRWSIYRYWGCSLQKNEPAPGYEYILL